MINDKKIAAWGLLAYALLFFTLLIVAFVGYAKGDTSRMVQPRPEHRVVSDYSGVVFMRGKIVDIKLLDNGREGFTNVRFWAYGQPLLSDESTLLCGYQAEQFYGMTGTVVLEYETQAHRMFEGIGCHELISVSKWEASIQQEGK